MTGIYYTGSMRIEVGKYFTKVINEKTGSRLYLRPEDFNREMKLKGNSSNGTNAHKNLIDILN